MKLWVGPSAFAEFYEITEDEVAQVLHVEGEGWQMKDSERVADFVSGLQDLFGRIEKEAN